MNASRFASTMGQPGAHFDSAANALMERLYGEGATVVNSMTHASSEHAGDGGIWITLVVRYIPAIARSEDDDPACVCGIHRSEHLLVGWNEWESRRS